MNNVLILPVIQASAEEPFVLLHGDVREQLATIPDNSLDSVVTDPPYELGFMGKSWDATGIANDPTMWAEVLRVLKPGGHLLSFGGSRTYHRMASAIEDAGFEIRDQIMWVYGSGFPKSMDVSKAIDKATGAARECTREGVVQRGGLGEDWDTGSSQTRPRFDNPVTVEAQHWEGWGTALKPAHEDIVMARKPHSFESLMESIARLICQLKSPAKDVEHSSMSNQNENSLPSSAQWSAVGASNTQEGLFALTDTLQSELETPSSLSIVSSWLNTLGEIYSLRSTFTTEMKLGLTTDLVTLNSLLSKITLDFTTREETPLNGKKSPAYLVRNLFNALKLRLEIILTTSAQDPAIFQDAGTGLHPNHEPIVLARKPLSEKTVASNVLTHGTGALNIGASRIPGEPVPINKLEKWSGFGEEKQPDYTATVNDQGRWPANLIHDGSEEVVEGFPDTKSGGYPEGISMKIDLDLDKQLLTLDGVKMSLEMLKTFCHPDNKFLYRIERVGNVVSLTSEPSLEMLGCSGTVH